MVISSSNVSMASKTTKSVAYTKKQAVYMSNAKTGQRSFNESSFVSDKKPQTGVSDNYRKPVSEEEKLRQLRSQLRQYMLNMRRRLEALLGKTSMRMLGYDSLDLSSGSEISVWNRVSYTEVTYEESESLSFCTTGRVKTEDGKDIEFDMTLELSRSYTERYEEFSKDTIVQIMTDPLVISLDEAPINVSDQKWTFDIDGDGVDDNISMLSSGSAFLALDRNGDGKINDGTELFGARTGNGFAELAHFDADGNGWIDENDSVYDKLLVWQKDATGIDRIMSLKEAGVGAIYLGNVASEYSLKSDDDNSHNAQIRKSGMYLTEDGRAKSVQQLDMVKALIS